MADIKLLLTETRDILGGLSSGTLSPVSEYEDFESEGLGEKIVNVVSEGSDVSFNEKLAKFERFLRTSSIDDAVECLETNWPTKSKAIQAWCEKVLHLLLAQKKRNQHLEPFKAFLRLGGSVEGIKIEKNLVTNEVGNFLKEWKRRQKAQIQVQLFKMIHEGSSWKDLSSSLISPKDLFLASDAANGWAPIHEIAARNQVSLLKKIVSKARSLKEDVDWNVSEATTGNTPLHEAAKMSAVDSVKILISLPSVDLNARNHQGLQAIDLATNSKIKSLLHDFSTASNEEGEFNLNPRESADLFVRATKSASNDSLSREERKLQQIIGFLDQIERYHHQTNEDKGVGRKLKAKAPSPSQTSETVEASKDDFESVLARDRNNGRTILHRLARRNEVARMREFLKLNKIPNDSVSLLLETTDNVGYTPLHEATMAGALEMARFLLFGHADEVSESSSVKISPRCNPSRQATGSGDTPLHEAAAAGHLQVVKFLVEVAGADASIKNSEGLLPEDLADEEVRGFLKTKRQSAESKTEVTIKASPKATSKLKKLKKQFLAEVGIINDTSPKAKRKDCAPSTDAAEEALVTMAPVMKRGPGRPRKHPKIMEAIGDLEASTQIPNKETDVIPQLDTFAAEGPPRALVMDFSTILPDGCDCLLLVRFDSEPDSDWYMLSNQFEALEAHLSQIKGPLRPSANPFLDMMPLGRKELNLISRLPIDIGRLVKVMQQFSSQSNTAPTSYFIPKSQAVKYFEEQWRYPLIGPFGYLHIPILLKSAAPTPPATVKTTNLPLKLKMKLLRQHEPRFDQRFKDHHDNNVKNEKDNESVHQLPKSPKNFQM